MFETNLYRNVAPSVSPLSRKSSPQCVGNRKKQPRREAPICYFLLMLLVINGEERNLAAPTLDALIEEMGMKGDRVAVEMNREIVPRAQWQATALKDGDRLEIVHFVGGGKT